MSERGAPDILVHDKLQLSVSRGGRRPFRNSRRYGNAIQNKYSFQGRRRWKRGRIRGSRPLFRLQDVSKHLGRLDVGQELVDGRAQVFRLLRQLAGGLEHRGGGLAGLLGAR